MNEIAPNGAGSAVFTLPGNQNAAGADIPTPLAKEIRRAGMLYRQIFRERDVAVYCAKGERSERIAFEVIRVQLLGAQELKGVRYPARETFPSSSVWGTSGFTYTNNSHRDPLAAAKAKAQEMLQKAIPL